MKRTLLLLLLTHFLCVESLAIDEFVESFEGNGPFETTAGNISGLDNPEWQIFENGSFRDGGFFTEANWIRRFVTGQGSFVERLEFKDVKFEITKIDPDRNAFTRIRVDHFLGSARARLAMDFLFSVQHVFPDTTTDDWFFGGFIAGDRHFFEVPSGSNVAMEMSFDQEKLEATFSFDNDFTDEIPEMTFGPFAFDPLEPITDDQFTWLRLDNDGVGKVSAIVDSWTLINSGLQGDFSENGILDIEDIDMLSAEVLAMTHNLDFDLNADELVDEFDRNIWVHDLKRTYFGDSNLDGEFNSADLVAVFRAGEYEDGNELNSTWATGDWNGDGDFTSRDLVLAFGDGGYEIGPRATQMVPEPSASATLLAPLVLGVLWIYRRDGSLTL